MYINKLIKSQDGQQIHYMPFNTPCYFNIAPLIVDGKKEGSKITMYSLGINNISFGVYKKKDKAIIALDELEKFLQNKSTCFQVQADTK